MVNLTVNLAGVELKNPIIPASGTFGYGREYAELYDLNILGSFSWKGTTGEARLGNPQPRIAEMTGGMLNAVGLQNPGIDAVIAKEVPNIAKIFQGPVIANVGGFSLEEYAENCRKLNDVEQVKLLEVNISCPNVHAGGKNFGCDPKAAAEVTKAVKAATSKPVFMKLTPNVTDIAEIAKVPQARHCQPHRRRLRPRRVPHRPADGVGCVRGGEYPHHRLRRRILRRGRCGNDAGGRCRCGSGRRQPERPLRLQDHCGKPARRV